MNVFMYTTAQTTITCWNVLNNIIHTDIRPHPATPATD